ncbi:MAG: hypothetical protein R3D69_14415 [Xanthobacteraceae bacterium]
MALAIVAIPPLLAGCGGMDFSMKDAEWFNRPSGMFNRTISVESPGFADNRPVADGELISADGFCAGMAAPTDANALTDPSAPMAEAPQGSAAIAIGRTECEVARAAGRPDNVAVSNEGGARVTVLTYLHGERPGIYRFTSGRLVSMERGAEPPPPPARNTKGQRPRRQG